MHYALVSPRAVERPIDTAAILVDPSSSTADCDRQTLQMGQRSC
jgi:hypothetical protein